MTKETDPDLALLGRIASGDKMAISSLHGRYATRLFRFMVGIVKSEAIAEELTNEVFLEVWRNASKFNAQAKVSTWMFTIGRNRAISHLRKRKESPLDEDYASQIPDDADGSETTMAKKGKAALMRECIERLPQAMREVVDLVYYQELSVAECAEVMGIPDNTVKTRMFHARKKLSEMFKHAGIDRGWP